MNEQFDCANKKKKCIIVTTIHTPTKQVLHYSNLVGWDLIIVGDSKTDDSSFQHLPCVYLGLEEQKAQFPTLYEKIPLRSYTRKMFGYLYAIKHQYTVIYDTDDDNQYTEHLDTFESNYVECIKKEIPGQDLYVTNIDRYETGILNSLLLQHNAKSFTYDKRTKTVHLKNDQSRPMEANESCISGIQRYVKTSSKEGFVNIYKCFTDGNIWPRGIPPNHPSIHEVVALSDTLPNLQCSIIQGLVNNDPDVDAHYRIHINPYTYFFEKRQSFDVMLDKYSVCPFNTQNTFWLDPEIFYALYLPVSVTFRYTDILRGFVALYQAWKHNKTIKFTFPTAIQERNEHDLQKDYESEVPMYETAAHVIELLHEHKDATLLDVYRVLAKHAIVKEYELEVLEEWLSLVASFQTLSQDSKQSVPAHA